MTDPSSICVLRLSAIGDCCHVLAVLRTLQSQWPDAALTWVIGKTEARLMTGIKGIELVVYDKQGGRAARKALDSALSDRQFDVLLNMHASWRANLVSRAIRSPRKIGFDKPRARDFQWLFTNERISRQYRGHVIDGLFGFAEQLGVKRREMRWDLPLCDDDYALAERLDQGESPTVLISPCSSDRARNFRNWPAGHFAAVARYAIERYGAQIVLTGGNSDAEQEYAADISHEAPDAIVNLVGRTSLKELAALIDRASVVICPDSGPAHIATAVGTPVIGLYATSNPGRTGPLLSEEWTINAYPEAVQRYIGKTPDQIRWGRRVRHPDAMQLIEVGTVTAKLDQLLA